MLVKSFQRILFIIEAALVISNYLKPSAVYLPMIAIVGLLIVLLNLVKIPHKPTGVVCYKKDDLETLISNKITSSDCFIDSENTNLIKKEEEIKEKDELIKTLELQVKIENDLREEFYNQNWDIYEEHETFQFDESLKELEKKLSKNK